MNAESSNKTVSKLYIVLTQVIAIVALVVATVSLVFTFQQRPVALSEETAQARPMAEAQKDSQATETPQTSRAAKTPIATEENVLERIRRERIIRAGYSGFKPYTIISPGSSDGKTVITGFCAGILEEIASRQTPPWRIEWHKVTFETLKADMESGRFDVFADAVYQTVPRAAEFGFTIPYSYFGVAVGLVRRGETRFKTFNDLDRPDITIALAQGWTSTEYAQRHLTKPKFNLIAVADDPFVQLQAVIAGRADIALQDVPTVVQFYNAHKDAVRTLWLDSPPTRVPAGFMTRRGQFELLHFLDVSIRALEADRTLDELDRKWLSLGDFPAVNLRPGTGLRKKH
jgi:ABC-type amino acid transport substrate-binding protein